MSKPISHNAHMFVAGIHAVLDKKFSIKEYLVKTKNHPEEWIAAKIAATQAEYEALMKKEEDDE